MGCVCHSNPCVCSSRYGQYLNTIVSPAAGNTLVQRTDGLFVGSYDKQHINEHIDEIIETSVIPLIEAVEESASNALDSIEDARLATLIIKGSVEETFAATEAVRGEVSDILDATQLAAVASGAYQASTLAAAIISGLAGTASGSAFFATGVDVDYIGLYRDNSGTAVELARYPKAEVVARKLDGPNSNSSVQFQIETIYGDVVFYIDDRGRVFVAGHPDSPIQEYLERVPDQDNTSDVFILTDANGHRIMWVDGLGKLNFSNRLDSLQSDLRRLDAHTLGRSWMRSSSASGIQTNLMTDYTAEAHGAFAQGLAMRGGVVAPLPVQYLPTNTQFDWDSVRNMTIDLGSDPTPIVLDTPYRPDDKVVHPTLAHFPRKWNGYEWLLGITPWSGNTEENPVLYGSNDLVKFDMLSSWHHQPMRPADRTALGYLSDIFFSYDPIHGEFIVGWRDLSGTDVPNGSTGGAALYYMTTINGIEWSDAKLLQVADTGPNKGYSMSPTLRYNPADKYWYLFANTNVAGYVWKSRTLSPTSWELAATSPGGYGSWHNEIINIGRRLLILNTTQMGTDVRLRLSDEDDWASFTDYPSPILVPVDMSGFNAKYPSESLVFYKLAASLVIGDNGKGYLQLCWTNSAISTLRKAFIAKSSEFDLA